MAVFLRFPGFRDKAVTLSYDDGADADKKLVEIINKYGLKCTFNIHHTGIGKGHDHTLTEEELFALYDGHEIAVHGAEHFSLTEVDIAMATRDILTNREHLEKVTGKITRGMAYANGAESKEIEEMLKHCGIVYARSVFCDKSFRLPENWLSWRGTCHHNDKELPQLIDRFLNGPMPGYMWARHPRLFYMWGHSFEFANNNDWHILEDFGRAFEGRDDVWFATNGEIYDYVQAYNSLVYSCDGTMIHNPTSTDVYLDYFRRQILVKAGETVKGRE